MPTANASVDDVDDPADHVLDDGRRPAGATGLHLVNDDHDDAKHGQRGEQHDQLDDDAILGDAVQHDVDDDHDAVGIDVLVIDNDAGEVTGAPA